MTLGEFLIKLQERGAIEVVDWDKVNSAYDALDLDYDAPIPVWSVEAQAWEV